jgi:hypothetical protein
VESSPPAKDRPVSARSNPKGWAGLLPSDDGNASRSQPWPDLQIKPLPPGDATVDLSGTVDINGQLVVDTPGTLQYEMAGNGPITYRESGSGAVTTTTIQRHRTRHH